ncbi:MAG TPA: response regulator [Chitinispirillaceae bacterium]|nr:response regulator [Chitinispirillaceae bacterium]
MDNQLNINQLDIQKTDSNRYTGTGVFVIMDDEESMRETIGFMVESFGYTPLCFENGKETIDYFSQNKHLVAAMILDLNISGGIGGKEAISEIRNICIKTPVYAMSGYSDDPIMSNPSFYGFTGSISKPFLMSQLGELLDQN